MSNRLDWVARLDDDINDVREMLSQQWNALDRVERQLTKLFDRRDVLEEEKTPTSLSKQSRD